MLVDSYDLERAVFDSGAPAATLGNTAATGVTALAVAPGPLRHALGVAAAPESLADFAGAMFHTFHSDVGAATAAALGARHTDVFGPTRDGQLEDGTIDITENSLDWMFNNGRAPYGTLNVALWPATAVLIVNPDTFAGLDGATASALDAATGSFESVDGFASGDVDLVAQNCDAGHRFVDASADDVAALRAAVRAGVRRAGEGPRDRRDDRRDRGVEGEHPPGAAGDPRRVQR